MYRREPLPAGAVLMASDLPTNRFDPIKMALQEVSARLDATLPICEQMPGEEYVCAGCPAECEDYCTIQEIRDILARQHDLPPKALKGQEDYDAIVSSLAEDGCPAEGVCEGCAFDIPGTDDCPQVPLREMLAKMRGRRSQ